MVSTQDIEDLSSVARLDHPIQNGIVKAVVNRAKNGRQEHSFEGDSFVPGTRSIYLRTWGCSHNSSDSEYMAGLLSAAGYKMVDDGAIADLWVMNSCTVKTPSETQLLNHVKAAAEVVKPVVVAGCVSQAAPNTPWLKNVSLLGVQQIDRIVEIVEETLKGYTVRLLAPKRQAGRKLGGASLSLPKIRKNPLIEILAINTGCLNHCTYCKTKQARGDLASYTIEELVARARQAFEEGVKEIWLTSEDLGAWGRDIDFVLPDLLRELVKVIPDGCMMRLGMTNPPYILDYLEDIAEILNHPRVYAFLHIPVQSGSDAVLTDMRREYNSGDFCRVVDFMRQNVVPDVSIATDMICAFPTETEDDFEESMKLVRKYKFPSLFINQFYPRPGTPAARMSKIDTREAKRRTKLMSDYFRSYHPYGRERIGNVYRVLITERATDNIHLVGHNKSYEQILVADTPGLMGTVVDVKIVECSSKFSMKAVVLSEMDKHSGALSINYVFRFVFFLLIGLALVPFISWLIAFLL